MIVGSQKSPEGSPVSIALVQQAIDTLYEKGELRIDVPTVGHRRSSFIGAVLRTLPDVEIYTRPQRVRIAPTPPA